MESKTLPGIKPQDFKNSLLNFFIIFRAVNGFGNQRQVKVGSISYTLKAVSPTGQEISQSLRKWISRPDKLLKCGFIFICSCQDIDLVLMGLIVNISKILIICWSIVWSATIFSTGALLDFKIFIGLVGFKTIQSLWFIPTVAACVFIIWAIGCFIILICCWVITLKKDPKEIKDDSSLDPDIKELLNRYAPKPK